MNNFSIIIPTFNEEGNIEILINEIITSIDNKKYKYEIIVVDDFSEDDTKNIIKKLTEFHKNLVILCENFSNLGQSRSIYNGIKISQSVPSNAFCVSPSYLGTTTIFLQLRLRSLISFKTIGRVVASNFAGITKVKFSIKF